jgi:hypothetical protein
MSGLSSASKSVITSTPHSSVLGRCPTRSENENTLAKPLPLAPAHGHYQNHLGDGEFTFLIREPILKNLRNV